MVQDSSFKKYEIEIDEEIEAERLDKYLGRKTELSLTRSRIQKLIAENLVMVNGQPAGHNHKLIGGEKIQIFIPPIEELKVEAEDIPLSIIYEDDYLLIVDKPAGMVTHPAVGNRRGTLVNALKYYSEKLSSVSDSERPGIVHRLDKNTSGLIMIAKNNETHLKLQSMLKNREINKVYYALVCGHLKKESDRIALPIGRSIKDRKKMTVTKVKSREAITEYKLLDRFKLHDLVEVNLLTGRTHQIRVHFSFLGHPVFGDPEYGGRLKWHRGVMSINKLLVKRMLELMPRQALHAKSLRFEHPISGEKLFIESTLPEDFGRLLDYLKKEGR
jgi:23S rRNA pseudouridine1911/1915/1917 synthase